jgi:hypothetical protein
VNRQNFKDSCGLFFKFFMQVCPRLAQKKQACPARMETGQGKPVLL